MATNIIVGSGDADQLDELLDGAKEIARELTRSTPPRAVSIQCARSIEEVRRRRGPDTVLLILAASLPQGRSGAPADQGPALDFIRGLATEPQPPACILVSEFKEHHRAVHRIRYCEWLSVDTSTDYVADCRDLAIKLDVIAAETAAPAAPAPPAPAAPPSIMAGAAVAAPVVTAMVPAAPAAAPQKYALIEVELPAKLNMATVRLEIHDGDEVWKSETDALQLKKSRVEGLVQDCKALQDNLSRWQAQPDQYYEGWRREYGRLGEAFGHLLWDTHSFRDLYNQGVGAARSNVRLRFSLEQPWFDGLWEALQTKGQFLMLESTIARRARRARQGDRLDRFSPAAARIDTHGGSLRVLVIRSNVNDHAIPVSPGDPLWNQYWSQVGNTLPRLGHLDDEVEALRELAARQKAMADPSQVEVTIDVLPLAEPAVGEPWSLAEQTKAALETAAQCYDVVHFAGHALFAEGDRGDGRGYLVFSGYPRPHAVPIATVAHWLSQANVQLVYLSCCRSGAASAALEFARNSIPMAIGFHWAVDDRKAPVFAKAFYRELLKSRLKVCPAINQARFKLYNDSHGDDPIWASPVLIAQPMDWLQVESVLKLRGSAAGPGPGRQAA